MIKVRRYQKLWGSANYWIAKDGHVWSFATAQNVADFIEENFPGEVVDWNTTASF